MFTLNFFRHCSTHTSAIEQKNARSYIIITNL